jgi:hypothetical protein
LGKDFPKMDRKERRKKAMKKVIEALVPLIKIWLCGQSFRIDEKTFSAIQGMSEKEAFEFLTK